MTWTDEQKMVVAEKLVEGLSARQIAALFPGVSRNAIIGVVARDKNLRAIGFARRPGETEGCGKLQALGLTYQRKPAPKAPRLIPTETTVVPLPEPVWRPNEYHLAGQPMSILAPRRCKFAVNEAGRFETHLFCGMPSDGAFCDHHQRVVYQPGSALDRANRTMAA